MCIFQTQIQELRSHKQLTGSPRANNAQNINRLIMQSALICLFNEKLYNNKSFLQYHEVHQPGKIFIMTLVMLKKLLQYQMLSYLTD